MMHKSRSSPLIIAAMLSLSLHLLLLIGLEGSVGEFFAAQFHLPKHPHSMEISLIEQKPISPLNASSIPNNQMEAGNLSFKVGSPRESHPLSVVQSEPPIYPHRAREKGDEGTVVVRVRVTPKGRAHSVVILSSSGHQRLDDEARRAISNWTFSPAVERGVVVASEIDIPVIFRILD